MTQLQISSDLALPLDFATEGIVVIGVRGSGKTNTEVRFAEQLHENGIPFLAIDPKGDWYGIRMDGEKPGLPVPVFGGLYGDFPIEEHLGSRIADVLVDNNVSAVVDVSRMSHGARARFLTDLFKQLMERHQLEPHVRTVIFEEAHRYIPQQVSGPVAALKEAAASVLLEGRAFGLGCWACTQRPARLHNDVLEEVDTAIIHRIGVTATADLKRVRDWVKHEDLGDEIGQSLTKLKAGEAWVLSPVSLGIVQRVQMARRTTFDSGATPVVGDAKTTRRRLATMADIDAPAIKEALAETIEKAKADDPRELRKRIAELERHRCPEAVAVEPERVEVPVLDDDTRDAFLAAIEDLRGDFDKAVQLGEAVREALTRWGGHTNQLQRTFTPQKSTTQPPVTGRLSGPARTATPRPAATSPNERRPTGDRTPSDAKLGRAHRSILTVLAQHGSRTKTQVALLTGYAHNGGGFNNALGALRTSGYIDGRDVVAITDAGVAALGSFEPLPTGRALIEHWNSRLSKAEKLILGVLVNAWPAAVTKEALADATGYAASGGGFNNALGRLRSLELIEGRAELRVVDTIGQG